VESLKKEGILAEADLRNEKISYKIREHSVRKVPIILAIGNNEKKDKTVSIRRIGSTDTEVVDLKDAIKEIAKENLALN
jgi:threonyl-tRNA synthetase